MMTDRKTKKFRGIAFVEFKDQESLTQGLTLHQVPPCKPLAPCPWPVLCSAVLYAVLCRVRVCLRGHCVWSRQPGGLHCIGLPIVIFMRHSNHANA